MRIHTVGFLACLCIGLVGLGATTVTAGQVDVANTSDLGCGSFAPGSTVVTNGTVTMSVSDQVCHTSYPTFVYSVSFLSSTIPGLQVSYLTFSPPPGQLLEFNTDLDYGLVLGSTIGLTSADVQIYGVFFVPTNFQVGDTLTVYLQSDNSAPIGFGTLNLGTTGGGFLNVPVLVPLPEAPSAILLGTGLLMMSGLMLGFRPRWRTVA